MTHVDGVSPTDLSSLPPTSVRATNALRFGIAGLLITASLFKGYELFARPGLPGQWMVFGQITLEWLLGVWLLSGRSRRLTWFISFGTFASFLLYSIWAVTQSRQSCGCFGRVEIDPKIIALIDSAVLALLVHQRRNWLGTAPQTSDRPVPFVAAVVPPLAALLVLNAMPAAQVDLNELVVGNGVVVLELESWVGKRLPVLSHIDVGDQLMSNTWDVIFYHHDCESCASELRLRSTSVSETVLGNPTAMIEVPPYGKLPDDIVLPDSWLRGQLSDQYEWFVSTPATITLSKGIVTNTSE